MPIFSSKTNSFRRPGGFCWPIGVTAALLGRLLPSDGHKLVKNLVTKLLQIVRFFDFFGFLNLYEEPARAHSKTNF